MAPYSVPPTTQDREQLGDGGFEIVVDDDAVEFGVMRHIGDGIPQAPLDDLVAVGLAVAQPGFELGARRRQDEHRLAVGLRLAHLLRALPVDFQDHVVAGVTQRLDLRAPGAVEVVEHLRVLEELALAA